MLIVPIVPIEVELWVFMVLATKAEFVNMSIIPELARFVVPVPAKINVLAVELKSKVTVEAIVNVPFTVVDPVANVLTTDVPDNVRF